MENNFVYAPVGNTGVTSTIEEAFDIVNKGEINDLGQFVLLDWLEFTIHYDFNTYYEAKKGNDGKGYLDSLVIDKRVRELYEDLFNITDIINIKTGKNGYTEDYCCKSIHAWTSTNVEMGIHFEITGQGCRQLDDNNINIFDLLEKINKYKAKYSRIDLSIDDFTNRYYTVNKIVRYVKNRQLVGKFKSFYNTTSGLLDTYDLLGNTVQLGSKASLVHVTFYDKLLEREANNYVLNENIKYWTRTEVRFRHEKATDVVNHLIKERQINRVVKGILKDYIRFVYKPNELKDNNKYRWPTCSWWEDFLENIDKLELLPIQVFTSIQRKKVWLNESVSKSEFMVLISEIDNTEAGYVFSEILFKLIKKGYANLKDKDIALINEEREKLGRDLLTKEEIDAYVRDIKNVILVKENDYLE